MAPGAFGQLVGYGNYNFVTPYIHGVTHGIALSLVAMVALSLALLGLLPYFGYLFGFFSPSSK